MTDLREEARDQIRRTLNQEFSRMEEDFDETRLLRKAITNKLMEQVGRVVLVDENGGVTEETDTGLRVLTTALKALSDTEKATAQAVNLKLRQSEQEIVSSAAAKDRIAIVLQATAPGKITQEFPSVDLEAQLASMFDSDIKAFELKSSPKDLSE